MSLKEVTTKLINQMNRWDDWVADDRMKKLTDESLEMKQTLIDQQKLLEAPKKTSSASHKRKSTASAVTARGDSIQDSEDRSTSAAAAGKATKRGREEVEKVSLAYYHPPLVATSSAFYRLILIHPP